MIGRMISHYSILEKLGEGGMGVVYKAEDTRLTRRVALKFLPHGLDAHEPERARFLQEARAAAILNHPNICTVYDIQEHEGQQFIVMEYVEGVTLREKIAAGKLPREAAVGYAIQIGEALEEAHGKGIVHRDIKAENIMVNAKNQVKVMDFGLAKLKGSLKLTKTSSTVGTLAYMAPEQIQGKEVDARSDIFSFGVLLYEMMSGRSPFQGEHEAAVIYSILNQEPEPLERYVAEAPSELLHLLGRALEKDPEDRYQGVHEMLIDLRRLKKDSARVSRQHIPAEGAREDIPPAAPVAAAPPAPVAGHGIQRKWIWLGGAGLAVLCAVFAVLFFPGIASVKLNPDRTFRALPVPFKTVGYGSLSTDGKWFVFPVQDDSGRWDIYWTNTAGGEPSRITHEESYVVAGVEVSPEVDMVAYSRVRESSTPIELRIAPLHGGVGRTVADTGIGGQWRPDGKRLGFLRAGRPRSGSWAPSESGDLEIWSVKPDGTDRRLELRDSLSKRSTPMSFCWSPDGGSIAWVRNYPEGHGEVMVRELSTGKEQQITGDRKTVDEVIWASNDNILFVSNRSGCSNVWVVPSGGGEAIQLTHGTIPIISARISADTRKLMYLQNEDIWQIWITGLDGGNARQVTFDDIRVQYATFSPDARLLACIIGGVDFFSRERHLYIMARDGRNRMALTSGPQFVGFCRWSFDGKWLAYISRSVEEPRDSNRVYIIQPSNPGTPRLLGLGSQCTWIDSANVAVSWKGKSLRYSIHGGDATQAFPDSTFELPLPGTHQKLVHDGRKGREGSWAVSIDPAGREVGEARRIPPAEDPYFVGPLDSRFRIYQKAGGNEIWRVWVATGEQERVGTVLPGTTYMFDVSMDGKEILWVNIGARSKLAMIENVFE